MIDPSRASLLTAALSIALLHTFVGVDHYLPFVVLGRARAWPIRKVLGITAICGLAHVLGSVALGAIGIGIGAAVGKLEWIEGLRGSMAAWGLIIFGLVYMAWAGLRIKQGHGHSHQAQPIKVSFWALFVVFALGPCEPLIPVLMAPAFEHDWLLVAQVAAVFSFTTIGTMVAMAAIGFLGLKLAPLHAAQRYGNLAAGAAILASGLAIQFLGI